MAFQSSKTLFELTNFLTRPLMESYPASTVMIHRQVLQKQLQTAFFRTTVSTPFTLVLSPHTLPPMPIYTASLMSGIKWADWARLLAPKGMYVFIVEGEIKARTFGASEMTTVWSASFNSSSESQTKEASRPTLPSLSRALESVRSRSNSIRSSASTPTITPRSETQEKASRPTLPSLSSALESVRSRSAVTPVRSPRKVLAKSLPTTVFAAQRTASRTPFQRKPTPLSQVIMISDDEDEDCDDSDSESDSGSTISSSSSLFSAASSSSSITSAASSTCSSPSTSPAECKPSLDLIRAAIKSSLTTKTTTTTTTKTAHIPACTPATAPAISRSDLRLVDRTNTNVTRYNYQGGQTAVMTGGVMLGAVRSKGASSPANKKKRNGGAAASNDWRKPRAVKA